MIAADIAERLGRIAPVSRETHERLEHLVARASDWSRRINLVADHSPATLWERHVLDSAQLFPLRRESTLSWCDLGSGGGFPGLVIAILAREADPDLRVTLVESDKRKAAFLLLMIRELQVNATALTVRAESLNRQQAETVSARALAPLPELLPLIARHMAPDGVALLPKGRQHAEETAEAQRDWAFAAEPFESILSSQSRILRVTKLRRINVK